MSLSFEHAKYMTEFTIYISHDEENLSDQLFEDIVDFVYDRFDQPDVIHLDTPGMGSHRKLYEEWWDE